MSTRGAGFVLCDSGSVDANRILLFGTEENMNPPERNEHWPVAETFKVSPVIFFRVLPSML